MKQAGRNEGGIVCFNIDDEKARVEPSATNDEDLDSGLRHIL